jgi:sulfonate transport system substrate-binding protein
MNATVQPAAPAQAIDRFTYTRCPAVPTLSALAATLGVAEDELGGQPDLELLTKSVGFTPKLEYPHEDVWTRSHGVRSKVVSLAWLEGRYPVYARGGEVDGVAALKGLGLGVVRQKNTPFDLLWAQQLKIYTTTLGTAGLTLEDVEVVELWRDRPIPGAPRKPGAQAFGADVALRALVRGEVDAIALRLPQETAELLQLDVLYDTHDHPDPLARVHPSVLRGIVVSEAVIAERREELVRLLAALAHPGQALERVASDLHFAPEQLAASYDNVAEGLQIDLNPTLVEALRVQKDFLLKHGLIDTDFDFDEWVDASLLQEARVLLAQWKRAGARRPLPV